MTGAGAQGQTNWYEPAGFNLNLVKLPVKWLVSSIAVLLSGKNKGDQPSGHPTDSRLDVDLAEGNGTGPTMSHLVLHIDKCEAELLGRT